jgi:ComEC/Rec2-related protein
MKRPFVVVALVYGGGLVLAEVVQPSLGALFSATLLFALLALFAGSVRFLLIWPLVFFAGWTNLVWRTAVVSPNDLRVTQGDSVEIVTLQGVLCETPSARIFIRDEKEVQRTLATVHVTRMLRKGTNWQAAFGKILVTTPAILSDLFFRGQTVELTGVLASPPGPVAEGLFDYRSYLRRQGVYYQLKTESTNDWRLLSTNKKPPLGDRFLAWAQTTLARGLPGEDEPLRLLWAMTLGWKTGLTDEIYEPFMRSGTMHIFAISGLHIALIAGILVSLLRLFQISRDLCGWLIVPTIWFYTAATGWQPSAIRSTIMMTVIITGWALERPSDLLNSLAAAAFIILLWDPQQLFGASFQLSFFVVLSIALLMPPLERLADRLLQSDPLLPAQLLPRWRKWLRTPLRWLSLTLATSFAAWLGSLPLTAYYFHLLSPITLFANLVIVPLSSVALASNLGSLLCGAWCPWMTVLFNHSGWWWMECMIKLSNWSTLVPSAFLYVRSPNGVDFAVYYALLIGACSGWLLASKRRPWLLGGIVALSLYYGLRSEAARRPAFVTVVPLSGGVLAYFHGPSHGRDMLVDTGNTNSVQFVTKPFLRAQGLNRLPNLLLTHGDLRHVGGANLIADLFSVPQVCVSPLRFRSSAYRRQVEEFSRTPGRLRKIRRGDKLEPWSVLHPEGTERFPRADDGPLALAATLNGTRVMLLSDLGKSGQEVLLQRTTDLHADIVITGLPYASEPLGDPLLAAINPRLIIVADSDYPAQERANAKLQQRLRHWRIPIIYTRYAGAVTLEFLKGEWTVRAMDGTCIQSRNLASRLNHLLRPPEEPMPVPETD